MRKLRSGERCPERRADSKVSESAMERSFPQLVRYNAFQPYRGSTAVVGRQVSGGEQVGSKEKGTPTQARSRHPRQGARRTEPGRRPLTGAWQLVLPRRYKSRRPAQVGGFVWKQFLTLTRLRIVNRAEIHPVNRLVLLKRISGHQPRNEPGVVPVSLSTANRRNQHQRKRRRIRHWGKRPPADQLGRQPTGA